MNKGVEDVRKETIADIEKQIALENNVFIRDALEAVKDFIDDPDELIISIAPDEPLSIQQLMQMNDPKKLAEELKLSVK